MNKQVLSNVGHNILDLSIKHETKRYAEENGIEDFKDSNRWLYKLKNRKNIKFVDTFGEEGLANKEGAIEFVNIFTEKSKNYDTKDIFNNDETGALGEKLNTLVIGKSKQPVPLKNKNLDGMNIVYTNQENAWMNKKFI
ncbi:hypothetical protein BB559_007216 [Furculomyces boomerangus]|uniref:DDE-1 domain-containing protein n=2 Tax=Harpellales TaxID=61421 RepID=A0A2T9XYD9_9FUNG|nr:hypothetical protein BB559_007216 [Furculomyces boomerangus]PVZ97120.1 hypothetical protein BB558_006947 [Smittium angustum]